MQPQSAFARLLHRATTRAWQHPPACAKLLLTSHSSETSNQHGAADAPITPVQEKFPGQGSPLLPSDAFGRARVRSLAQHVACEIQPLQNTRLATDVWQLSPGDCMYLWVAP